MNIGILFKYMHNPFGLECGYDFFGVSGTTSEEYKSVKLNNYTIFRAGIIYTIFRFYRLAGSSKIEIAGGANYSTVKLHKEYLDLIDDPFVIRDTGPGIGYYSKFYFQMFFPFGITWIAGLIYEYEGQKFEGTSEKYDSQKIQGNISFGYKF